MQWLLCRSLRGFALTVPVTRRHFSLLMPQGTAAARCGGASGSVGQPETQDKISIIMDEIVWNKMKDTGASDLSPESGSKPSGGIFVFHYLFRRGKPWYTEFKVINQEVPL